MNDRVQPDRITPPPPDSVEQIPSLHPATAKMHEAMIRVLKNVTGIYERWLIERRR